jgi:hypothetical protein
MQSNLNSLNQLAHMTDGVSLSANGNNTNSLNTNTARNYRPKPIVDPSRITPTELTCFKVKFSSLSNLI